MVHQTKISRRAFALGLVFATTTEAARPLIDLNKKAPSLITLPETHNFLQSFDRDPLFNSDGQYFDPEPDLNLGYFQTKRQTTVNKFHAQKNFDLNLINKNTGEQFEQKLRKFQLNSSVNYNQLNVFLRDWRENKSIMMDRQLVNNFLSICEALVSSGDKIDVYVTSGFRTKKTNDRLRQNSSKVAKNSMHLSGRAIDFTVKDISVIKLAEVAEKLTPGGLGVYSNFIHLDTGPYRRWTM